MQRVPVEIARKYLREAAAKSGLTLTEIARKAKLTASALTRPANNPKHKGEVKVSTLRRVASVTDHTLPANLAGPTGGSEAAPADALEIAILLAEGIPTGQVISAEQKAELIRKTVARLKVRGLVG